MVAGFLLGAAALARAETQIAVVANFVDPAQEIAAAFAQKTGREVAILSGSTGGLFAQIAQGAPFEVFLSADEERPRAAIAQGLAVEGTAFPYAIGRLALWSQVVDVSDGPAVLKANAFHRLAIANPTVGPGGVAAVETLRALGVFDRVEPKIVRGNTIAQVFQFVETGNAELGFVALSQLQGDVGGSRWLVPENLHTSIRQDAVLLKNGAEDETARKFLDFLKTPEARKIIEKYGFLAP